MCVPLVKAVVESASAECMPLRSSRAAASYRAPTLQRAKTQRRRTECDAGGDHVCPQN